MSAFNDDRMVTFLSLLALLCIAFGAGAVVLALVSLVSRSARESLRPLRDGVGQLAVPLAFAVALVTSLGSLYLSERLKLPPCRLCWYQRICMYPLVGVLGAGALRQVLGRDDPDEPPAVRWYALPLVVVGIGISTYHYLLERFPEDISFTCSDDVPCETVWIWKYHFLSIPGMAWVAFLTIGVLLVLARPSGRSRHRGAATGAAGNVDDHATEGPTADLPTEAETR